MRPASHILVDAEDEVGELLRKGGGLMSVGVSRASSLTNTVSMQQLHRKFDCRPPRGPRLTQTQPSSLWADGLATGRDASGMDLQRGAAFAHAESDRRLHK